MRLVAIVVVVAATVTPSLSSAQSVEPTRAVAGADVTVTQACASPSPPVIVLGTIEIPGTGANPKWSLRLPSTVPAGSYLYIWLTTGLFAGISPTALARIGISGPTGLVMGISSGTHLGFKFPEAPA